MRTFLGLSFSVAMGRRIAEQLEKEAQRFREGPLKDAGVSLAWVPPANLHLTLKFLGSIPPESLDAIALRMRQRMADQAPIPLRVKGYGAFPTEGQPRILWIGVAGGKVLEQLHATVEREMEDLGFSREARPFHPHITVARVVSMESGEAGNSTEKLWESEMDFGEERVAEIVVYESLSINKPGRTGVEYIARARAPFLKV